MASPLVQPWAKPCTLTYAVHVTRSTLASKKLLILVAVSIASPSVSAAVSLVPRKTNFLIRSLLAELVKTPGMKIPGVFLCLIFPLGVAAECGLPTGESVKVARVSDGDTLKLQDGRSVRVLGINAPEITHGKNLGQPLGRESRVAAQAFIDAAQGRVRLGFEQETRDHYGRLLAHVYDMRGRSLAVAQLRAGMAMQIAVPPNTAQRQCLLSVEREVRKKPLGLWRDNYWQPLPTKLMRGTETGFRQVRGRITKVSINSAVWLEFEGKLVARVAKKDWPAFGYQKSDWLKMKGREVELRGWINPQKTKVPLVHEGNREIGD
jgi:micrococcal nuclease